MTSPRLIRIFLCNSIKGAKKGVEPMPMWVRRYVLLYFGRYAGINVEKFAVAAGEVPKDGRNGGLLDSEENREHGYNNGTGGNEKIEEMKRLELLERNQCSAGTQGAMILNELRVVTDMIREQDKSDLVAEEWEALSMVVDRIFFVCFCIIFLVSSLSILLPAAMSDGSGRPS